MAFVRINRICGDDDLKWTKAETATRRHIEARIRLWDSALESSSQSRCKQVSTRWMPNPGDNTNAAEVSNLPVATSSLSGVAGLRVNHSHTCANQ